MEKLNTSGTWHFSGNIMDSVKGADAVLLITEWDEYKDIDWKAISCYMRSLHGFLILALFFQEN